MNTKCEIVYNGIHSLQIKDADGTPQGRCTNDVLHFGGSSQS